MNETCRPRCYLLGLATAAAIATSPAAHASCPGGRALFKAAPLYEGAAISEPDLLGEVFWLTRYGRQLERKLNPANGVKQLVGVETYELTAQRGRFYVLRSHVHGSPPITDASFASHTDPAWPKEIAWTKRLPASPGLFEIRFGPLSLMELKEVACE